LTWILDCFCFIPVLDWTQASLPKTAFDPVEGCYDRLFRHAECHSNMVLTARFKRLAWKWQALRQMEQIEGIDNGRESKDFRSGLNK
jgi:hypothetical protein